jgi:cohesin loading factor subunit SCC2
MGDKTATKRNENPISWHRLPFATAPLLTTEDAEGQKATVCSIHNTLHFMLTLP